MPPRSAAQSAPARPRIPPELSALAKRIREKGGGLARRGGTAAARAAWDEKHTIAALVTGGALGYAERQNMQIPTIPALGRDGTVAVAAFFAGRAMKSKTLSHIATGAGACAMKDMVRSSSFFGSPAAAPAPQGAPQGSSTPVAGAGVDPQQWAAFQAWQRSQGHQQPARPAAVGGWL